MFIMFLLEGLFKSFIYIPIGLLLLQHLWQKVAINIAQEAFVLGLRLAAPIMTVSNFNKFIIRFIE